MKTAPHRQRERIKKNVFCFVFICGCINHSAFAETDTEDRVLANLVYFQPLIYIPEKTQPCQGIRISESSILTSPTCHRKVLDLMNQVTTMEVQNSDSVTIGFIKASNKETAIGLMSMESQAGTSLYTSLTVSTGRTTSNTDLTANYLVQSNEGMNVIKHPFAFGSKPSAVGQMLIQLPHGIHLPDGAAIKLKNTLFCVVADNACIRPPYLLNSLKKDSDSRCPDVNSTYHFHCGRRAIGNCYENVVPGAAMSIHASGTCINPKSQEQCSFKSEFVVSFGTAGDAGKSDEITCSSCLARYIFTSSSEPYEYGSTVDCNPQGCMPGCKNKPDSKQSKKRLIAPIVGGIGGGFLLMNVVIGTVVGCLYYKYRHRAKYQKM